MNIIRENKMIIRSILTVMFDKPFWIALYERFNGDKYEVCKITFGTEPKDYEVYEFLLKNWKSLRFSPSINVGNNKEIRINPKRMQREISTQLQDKGIGTKAQQALKLQHEQNKIEHKVKNREKKEAEKEYKFLLYQEKKKAKHRGK